MVNPHWGWRLLRGILGLPLQLGMWLIRQCAAALVGIVVRLVLWGAVIIGLLAWLGVPLHEVWAWGRPLLSALDWGALIHWIGKLLLDLVQRAQ